ncbi:MAG: hypothetical protein ACXVMS_17185 [Flavisolibacter sp.]
MDVEDFDITIVYKGKEMVFPARLVIWGYVYKIETEVQDRTVQFERDEENAWRAIAQGEDLKNMDVELVKEIGAALEKLFA